MQILRIVTLYFALSLTHSFSYARGNETSPTNPPLTRPVSTFCEYWSRLSQRWTDQKELYFMSGSSVRAAKILRPDLRYPFEKLYVFQPKFMNGWHPSIAQDESSTETQGDPRWMIQVLGESAAAKLGFSYLKNGQQITAPNYEYLRRRLSQLRSFFPFAIDIADAPLVALSPRLIVENYSLHHSISLRRTGVEYLHDLVFHFLGTLLMPDDAALAAYVQHYVLLDLDLYLSTYYEELHNDPHVRKQFDLAYKKLAETLDEGTASVTRALQLVLATEPPDYRGAVSLLQKHFPHFHDYVRSPQETLDLLFGNFIRFDVSHNADQFRYAYGRFWMERKRLHEEDVISPKSFIFSHDYDLHLSIFLDRLRLLKDALLQLD